MTTTSPLAPEKLAELEKIEAEYVDLVRQINHKLVEINKKGGLALNMKVRAEETFQLLSKTHDIIFQQSSEVNERIQTLLTDKSKNESLKIGFQNMKKDSEKSLRGYADSKEKYYNLAKMCVSGMNVKGLNKLDDSQVNNDLLKFLYKLLYGGNDFNSSAFRNIAFGSDAADFQSRLATFDMKVLRVNPELYTEFDKKRGSNYPQSEKVEELIDLLTWMDYIKESHIASLEEEQKRAEIKEQEEKYGNRVLKIQLTEDIYNAQNNNKNYLKDGLDNMARHMKAMKIVKTSPSLPKERDMKDLASKFDAAYTKNVIDAKIYE